MLNEFYNLLGLDATEIGDELGWTLVDDFMWIDFDHRKSKLKDGREYYLIETPYGPSTEWREYW